MLNRKQAPPITEAADFKLSLPPQQKYILANGVELYCIDLGTQDTLMINWIFFAGNNYEKKKGVAAATNYMLKSGTSARSAFEINEHFEYYGAHLGRHPGHETADLSLHCMNRHAGNLLPVVAELITDSVFPEEELAIYRKNMQQKLQVNLRKNDFVAGRLIESYLFGEDHPYGRYSALTDFDALDTGSLADFYREHYLEGHCVIFAAGRLPAGLVEDMEKYFGALPLRSHRTASRPEPALSPASARKYRITNDPDGVQGAIRIARSFPNRHHPDFQPMQVLNNLFGGFFGSRLMMNIREDKGYTYGIHSYLLNLVQESAFMISTEAGKDVSEATIAEVFREMALLREKPVDAAELQTTRNYMIGILLGDLDGPFQVAARWKSIILNGLDEDYFYRGIRAIRECTPETLLDLANRYFRPEDFYDLIVV